jgi:hypothetical protein
MAKDLFWTIVTFTIIIAMLVLAFWPQDKNQVVVKYDCRQLMGGWHPDIPIKVQEECKKRNTK